MQSDEAPELRLVGATDSRDHRAQDPSDVFRPLDISTQPENIVGYTAWNTPRDAAQLHWLIARVQHAEGIHGAVPEDPGVLTVATPLHRDDRPFRFGNPHQSPWNCSPPTTGIEHVSTQHHAARVEASVIPHGRSG